MWDCLDQAVTEVAIHNSFLANICSKYIRYVMDGIEGMIKIMDIFISEKEEKLKKSTPVTYGDSQTNTAAAHPVPRISWRINIKLFNCSSKHELNLLFAHNHKRTFRALMVELGYQAGQHELLADEFLKRYPAEIKNTIKDVLKMVSEIKKELKIRRSTLEKSYKCLEKTKSKYVKGQDELTLSEDFTIEKSSKKVSAKITFNISRT